MVRTSRAVRDVKKLNQFVARTLPLLLQDERGIDGDLTVGEDGEELNSDPFELGWRALTAFKVSYEGGESAGVGSSGRGCFSMIIGEE